MFRREIGGMLNKEYLLGILCMKQKNRRHTCVFQFPKRQREEGEEVESEREEGNPSKIGSEEREKEKKKKGYQDCSGRSIEGSWGF